jgi:hypothetical protein
MQVVGVAVEQAGGCRVLASISASPDARTRRERGSWSSGSRSRGRRGWRRRRRCRQCSRLPTVHRGGVGQALGGEEVEDEDVGVVEGRNQCVEVVRVGGVGGCAADAGRGVRCLGDDTRWLPARTPWRASSAAGTWSVPSASTMTSMPPSGWRLSGAAHDTGNSRACGGSVSVAWSARGRVELTTALTTTWAALARRGRRRRSTTTRSEPVSWVVLRVHTEEVTGSIPVSPTAKRPGQRLVRSLGPGRLSCSDGGLGAFRSGIPDYSCWRRGRIGLPTQAERSFSFRRPSLWTVTACGIARDGQAAGWNTAPWPCGPRGRDRLVPGLRNPVG